MLEYWERKTKKVRTWDSHWALYVGNGKQYWLESQKIWIGILPFFLTTVWIWVSHFISLALSFFLCKARRLGCMISQPSLWSCEPKICTDSWVQCITISTWTTNSQENSYFRENCFTLKEEKEGWQLHFSSTQNSMCIITEL